MFNLMKSRFVLKKNEKKVEATLLEWAVLNNIHKLQYIIYA